ALAIHQGERGRRGTGPALETHQREEAGRLVTGAGAALAAVEAADPHVVERGEPGEGADELEGAGHPARAEPVRGKPGHVTPVEPDAAPIRPQGARDQVEERGLAGAVRPHD